MQSKKKIIFNKSHRKYISCKTLIPDKHIYMCYQIYLRSCEGPARICGVSTEWPNTAPSVPAIKTCVSNHFSRFLK